MNLLATMPLHSADYVILVGYFVIMLAIGAYFWRRMRGLRDYFTARNQIPWWLSGISFYMTSFTAFLFIAYSELAFRYGFVAIVLGWTVVPAVLIGAMFLSGRWRRARIDSPVEYLEERYGLGLRQTFGWANIPIRMLDNGLRLYAMGLFVSGTVGLDLETSILVTGGVTLLYTFAGGLWAATVTDFVQFVVLLAGIAVLLPAAMLRIGGISGLVQHSPEGFFRLTAGPYTPWYFVAWFLIVLFNYNTSFGLIQRYYSVRDEQAARRTGLLVAGLLFVATPLFLLPAMAARQFMPEANPKDIYATLCTTLLPTGALGLVIAAMFSATMSSLSGDYNAVAAVLTNDVYLRLVHPAASQRRLVMVGRLMTFCLGLLPLAIAIYVARNVGTAELFRKMATIFSIASAPIAIPMLAGLIWRRATNAGATTGFLGGLTVGILLHLALSRGLLPAQSGSAEILLGISTAATTLVLMVVVSLLYPARGEEARRTEDFVHKLACPIPEAASEERDGRATPWRAIGIAIACTAILLLAIVPAMGRAPGYLINLTVAGLLLLVGVGMVIRGGGSPAEVGVQAPSTQDDPGC